MYTGEMLVRVVLGRSVGLLSEEALRAAAVGSGVIDVYVVVLAGDGLLDERLLDADPIDLEVVLIKQARARRRRSDV